MPESMNALWRNASPLKRALLAGVPAVIVALGAVGGIYAVAGGGGDSRPQTQAAAPTAEASSTAPAVTPTRDVAAILRYIAALATPTPGVNAGLQASSGGGSSTGGSSGGGGGTTYSNPGGDSGGSAPPDRPAGGSLLRNADEQSGQGPALSTDMTLVIPSIGVNASVQSRTVGTDGVMGNPTGPWPVVWYDFSQSWIAAGGYPGQPGANAVFAGHVDYIGVGPAVFWSIRDLNPGDIVTVNTSSGAINYSIQWSQWADPAADFSQYINQTGQDSITLVTCIGGFSGGHYSNRLIVRGVRI